MTAATRAALRDELPTEQAQDRLALRGARGAAHFAVPEDEFLELIGERGELEGGSEGQEAGRGLPALVHHATEQREEAGAIGVVGCAQGIGQRQPECRAQLVECG